MKSITTLIAALLLAPPAVCAADTDTKTVRVFIFAGQSNMEGADSNTEEITRFPPFAGLDAPQKKVRFSYKIGREDMQTSDGWVAFQPVNRLVGPELSFARRVSQTTGAPIAIIKCASGGTALGSDWNPDEPSGFKLYPLALDLIRSSLAELDRMRVPYRIEGFMWHQGENDTAFGYYRGNAAKWLQSTVAKSRQDLALPALKWFVSQQAPAEGNGLDPIDITANLAALAAADPAFIHLKAFNLPPQQEKLVITAAGIVELGEILAKGYLDPR